MRMFAPLGALYMSDLRRRPVLGMGVLMLLPVLFGACSSGAQDGSPTGGASGGGSTAPGGAGSGGQVVSASGGAGSGGQNQAMGGSAMGGQTAPATGGSGMAGQTAAGTAGTGGQAATGSGGTSTAGSGGEVSGAGGAGGGGAGAGGAVMQSSVCPTPNCDSIFNGQDLSGWTVVEKGAVVKMPASSWSIVNGAMHSLAPNRGYIYTAKSYGDFRFIFSVRQVKDPTPSHQPCVLYWGTSVTADAMLALQVQPPVGYLWDYRLGRSVAPPSSAHTSYNSPNTVWNRCEMLANAGAGTVRFACCLLPTNGNGACTNKATEVVDFDAKNSKGPFVGTTAPLGLQIHTAGQIDEYKDLYVESPVAAPNTLLLLTPH